MSRPRKKDKHLPRCVHLRHGAYYYVKGGKWERLGTDLTQALIAYSRKVSPSKGGMVQLIERTIKMEFARKTNPLSENTKKQYGRNAERLKVIMQEFDPVEVKPKHIAQIVYSFADRPNLANQMLSMLRVIFNHALRAGEIEANPCFGIERYAVADRDRYITDTEYKAIRSKAPERLKLIMDICYLTGQRITDVLNIRLNDITEHGIAFRQQKTDHKLIVEWSSDLRRTVDAAKALPKPKYAVPMTLFYTKKGTAPSYRTAYVEWCAACEAAGVVDANPHDLRAKSGTDAEKQGHDPQALLGHATANQTKTYLRDPQIPKVTGPKFN